jgi:hypothetical protein
MTHRARPLRYSDSTLIPYCLSCMPHHSGWSPKQLIDCHVTPLSYVTVISWCQPSAAHAILIAWFAVMSLWHGILYLDCQHIPWTHDSCTIPILSIWLMHVDVQALLEHQPHPIYKTQYIRLKLATLSRQVESLIHYHIVEQYKLLTTHPLYLECQCDLKDFHSLRGTIPLTSSILL